MGKDKNCLTHTQEVLLALLRGAFHGRTELAGGGLDAAGWRGLYDLAARQGVLAIAYDGVMLLPKEQRPPREVLLGWGMNVLSLERRYERQLAALGKIVSTLEADGVRVMLLKGAGLAADYPVPSHRECGDIDLYTFGDDDRLDALAALGGGVVTRHISKHTNFEFDGVPVENHSGFLETDEATVNRRFEEFLLGVVDAVPGMRIEVPGATVDRGNPMFNAVFVFCHAVTHFQPWGIVIRHFCDWGTLLAAHHREFDCVEFRRVMGENRYLKLADTFTYICSRYLGFDIPQELYAEADSRLAVRILRDTFSYVDQTDNSGLSTVGLLKAKMRGFRRLVSNKWKYDAAYPGEFWARLGFSVRVAAKSLLGR